MDGFRKDRILVGEAASVLSSIQEAVAFVREQAGQLMSNRGTPLIYVYLRVHDVPSVDIDPEYVVTAADTRKRLLKVERQLAERLKLHTVREQLIALDQADKLVEDELVAEWHELFSSHLDDVRQGESFTDLGELE